MKLPSKLTRRQLALRLFGLAVVINGLLLMLFLPSTPTQANVQALPPEMVELTIRGTLLTPFAERKSLLLSAQVGRPIGPVLLLRQEEENLIVALDQNLYRQHHLRLSQESWAGLPYLDGLLNQKGPRAVGVTYEIAY